MGLRGATRRKYAVRDGSRRYRIPYHRLASLLLALGLALSPSVVFPADSKSPDLFAILHIAIADALVTGDDDALDDFGASLGSACLAEALAEFDTNLGDPEHTLLSMEEVAGLLAAGVIITCPHDVDFRVLEEAIEIVGNARTASAKGKLKNILGDDSHQGVTRGQAAVAIGKIASHNTMGNLGVLGPMTDALSDPSWNVRAGACLGFGEWARTDILPELEHRFQNDEHPVVQLSCARAVLVITGEEPGVEMVSARDNPHGEYTSVQNIIDWIMDWFEEHFSFE